MTHYLHVFSVTIEAETEEQIEEIKTLIDDLTEYAGVGHVTAAELAKTFRSADGVADAEPEELRAVEGVGEKTAENISEGITSEEDRIRRANEEHSPTMDELEERVSEAEDVSDIEDLLADRMVSSADDA